VSSDDGSSMVLYQAEYSYFVWHGIWFKLVVSQGRLWSGLASDDDSILVLPLVDNSGLARPGMWF
jgi:hypothetical protein